MKIVSSVVVASDAENSEEIRSVLKATLFVNQLPRTVLDVYWENHNDGVRLEAAIQPRGG